MRVLILTAALLATPPQTATAQVNEPRPVGASVNYRRCVAASDSEAGRRACSGVELRRSEVWLHDAIRGFGVDDEAQALWVRFVDTDCKSEAAIYGMSNGAADAEMDCRIERTIERVQQVMRAGRE